MEKPVEKKTVPTPTSFDAFKAHPCPTCDGTGRVGELVANGLSIVGTRIDLARLVALCSRQWWENGGPSSFSGAYPVGVEHKCDRPKGHDGACATSSGVRAPDGPVSR